jgi:tetratricopeptide (TPR) repeat protein
LLQKASSAPSEQRVTLLQDAALRSADVPGVQAVLADTALAAGDHETAERAANAALATDSMYAPAHRILAEILLARGDPISARASVAHALAYYPPYARAWRVAEAIAGRSLERNVSVQMPFIEVDDRGAVIIVTCDRPFCEGFAACKAAFRYEPHFRAAILQEPPTDPYHLSATEEVVCLEAALGAYVSSQQSEQAKRPPPDPLAELLLRLAAERGLSAYAMFEILGRHRPEWLRVAPKPAHDAIVNHVLGSVFDQRQPPAPVPVVPGGAPVTAQGCTVPRACATPEKG